MSTHSIADKIVTLPTLQTFKDNADVAYAQGSASHAAYRAASIPSGQVDSTSTSTAFTATVPGVDALYDGVAVYLRNGVVTSAAGFTLNVNGLGAKPVYTNLAAATAESTKFNINYTMLFVYDSTRVSGGCWDCYNGYDSNSNSIGYQLRTNSTTLPMETYTRRYRLLFTGADGAGWVSANSTATNTAAANKTVNTEPIDPFGPIVYYGTTTNLDAGTAPAATALWQQYVIDLRYSFYPLTLTFPAPVYLKCQPLTYDWTEGQQGTGAVMQGITQQLPTHDDGYVYILLGIAYSATNIELRMEHPVYHYDGLDGGIQHWDGDQSISAAEIDAILAS